MVFTSRKKDRDQKSDDVDAAVDYKVASSRSSLIDDDKELEAMGYVPSFKREFSNLATVSTYNASVSR